LLRWGAGTLFEHQLNVLQEGPTEEVVAVVGQRAAELVPLAMLRPKVRTVIDPRYIRGALNGLHVGLRTLSSITTPVMVVPVEFPIDALYLKSFVDEGTELLEQNCDVVVSKEGHQTAFPMLIGSGVARELGDRRPRPGGLGEWVTTIWEQSLCSVSSFTPKIGKGGPPIGTTRSYEKAKRKFRSVLA
jgi:CTP:molybdopterin cytidylyltransferase MocA